MAIEFAALHEGESAGAAEGTGAILRAAPDGFELDVPHAGEEEFRILTLEFGERLHDGVLGPTLRVRFRRVFEKAPESGGQIRGEADELVVEREAAALATRKLLRRPRTFARGDLAISGGTPRSASKAASSASKVRFGGKGGRGYSLRPWDEGILLLAVQQGSDSKAGEGEPEATTLKELAR